MAEKPHEEVEMAPDPEEDDLDDLDDVLDEFQAKPISTKPAATPSSSNAPTSTAPAASGPGRPATEDHRQVMDPGDEDFTKQLQAGMTNLIGELDSNPDMQKHFEQMMQELIAAGAAPTDHEAGEHLRQAAEAAPKAPPADDKPSTAKGSSGKKEDFSDTIRKTMERMQQSGDAATAATSSSGGGDQSEEDLLAQMMRELQNGGGEGGEEDFNKMLMTMMTQLTNKEILYEPMKELHDKFPAWLEKNAAATGKKDLARYREQQSLVGEIVGRFERKGYTDENEADREYIVERMQKMQAAGSPPPDLVGDMSAAQDALGDLDGGCPQQ
ncbi:hypothetical protein LTR85_006969 [Meristemomyces frigidus]|nr:hypothetical protein LTR85_006969 [Meristemomyces frigidus]